MARRLLQATRRPKVDIDSTGTLQSKASSAMAQLKYQRVGGGFLKGNPLRTQQELSHTSDSFGADSEISAHAPSLVLSLGSLTEIAKSFLHLRQASPAVSFQAPANLKLASRQTSRPFCLICSLLKWPPALLMPSQFGWRSTKSLGRTLSAHVPGEDENYATVDGHVMSVQVKKERCPAPAEPDMSDDTLRCASCSPQTKTV